MFRKRAEQQGIFGSMSGMARWGRGRDEVYCWGIWISDGGGEGNRAAARGLNGPKYLLIGNNERYLEDDALTSPVFQWRRQYYELKAMGTKTLFCFISHTSRCGPGTKKDRFRCTNICQSEAV